MRANRDDNVPVFPAEGDDLVVCSAHQSRRLAKFCTYTPVCNAERVLIGYTYHCKEELKCTPRTTGNTLSNQHRTGGTTGNQNGVSSRAATMMMTATNAQTLSESAATETSGASHEFDAPQQQQKPRGGASRGPSRYYDLSSQQGPNVSGTKKVCWYCGMESHEKPNCPNTLCRICHTMRGQHHICQAPHPSPFVVLSPTLLLSESMSSVQCVSCLSMGHFDCSSVQGTKIASCGFCAEKGHNAYDCIRRKEQVPDRWIARVLEKERCLNRGENDTAPVAVPPYSASANVAAGYNNHSNAGRGYNAASRRDNRYIHTRENNYCGGGHAGTVDYRRTNSSFQRDRGEPYAKHNQDKSDHTHHAEVEHYSRNREGRSRTGGATPDLPSYSSRVSSFAYDRGPESDHTHGEMGERRRMPQSQHPYRYQRQSHRRHQRGGSSDGNYDDLF